MRIAADRHRLRGAPRLVAVLEKSRGRVGRKSSREVKSDRLELDRIRAVIRNHRPHCGMPVARLDSDGNRHAVILNAMLAEVEEQGLGGCAAVAISQFDFVAGHWV